jgi:putative transposase
MAQGKSALFDLLEELRTAAAGQVMNRILGGALHALIELEATGVIGAGRHERTGERRTQGTRSGPS